MNQVQRRRALGGRCPSSHRKKDNLIKQKQSPITLLYSCEENNQDQLFWENIEEPYREILEDCYHHAENSKYSHIKEITNSIKYNRLNYIKFGLQLYQVRYYKLYKSQFNSFKEYCEQEIHYPVWRVNKAIEASRVAIELIKYGFNVIPQNEAQARPLTKLNSIELINKWQEVLETYPFHTITASRIEKIIFGEPSNKRVTLKLPNNIVRDIENKAIENKLSTGELIAKIFQGEIIINSDGTMEKIVNCNEENIEDINKESLQKWQKDLTIINNNEGNKLDQFAEELAEEVKHTVTDFREVIKKCFIKSFLQSSSA
ncbi:MAG: hypothetical protein IGQ45_00360 [Cyanobacterium sp. T60_A2020_053]|nr:hypothetical protein [Cyanobacterium sp. T60_A2020_053]